MTVVDLKKERSRRRAHVASSALPTPLAAALRATSGVRATSFPPTSRCFERFLAMWGRNARCAMSSRAWSTRATFGEREPLLANDPHLGVGLPGVWMQMGLHCRELSAACPLDVAGVTFSGVPGVIIGHNADIAWGFTNLGPDVTDLFLERDSRATTAGVRDGDRRLPMQVRTETIEVAGERRRGADACARPSHGPLISDVSSDVLADRGCQRRRPTSPASAAPRSTPSSLAWTVLDPAHHPPTRSSGSTAPPTGTSSATADLRVRACPRRTSSTPTARATSATSRRVGSRSGKLGQRRHDAGPRAGSAPRTTGPGDYVPFDGLPSVLDPDEGFIATANQAVIDARSYPYLLTEATGTTATAPTGSASSWAMRLVRGAASVSVRGDGCAIQLDSTATRWRRDAGALPARHRGPAPTATPTATPSDLLRDWDFTLTAPTARRRRTSTWCGATCSSSPSTTTCASESWPDGGDRWIPRGRTRCCLDDPPVAVVGRT